MFIVAHHDELDVNHRRLAFLSLFFLHQKFNAVLDFLQVTAYAVSGITRLLGPVYGDDDRIKAGSDRLARGFRREVVAVRARGHKDAFPFGIFHKSQEFFIDERLALLVKQQVKNHVAGAVEQIFEGVEIHDPGSTGHFAVAGDAQRTLQIANVRRLDGKNERAAPDNRFLQKR